MFVLYAGRALVKPARFQVSFIARARTHVSIIGTMKTVPSPNGDHRLGGIAQPDGAREEYLRRVVHEQLSHSLESERPPRRGCCTVRQRFRRQTNCRPVLLSADDDAEICTIQTGPTSHHVASTFVITLETWTHRQTSRTNDGRDFLCILLVSSGGLSMKKRDFLCILLVSNSGGLTMKSCTINLESGSF